MGYDYSVMKALPYTEMKKQIRMHHIEPDMKIIETLANALLVVYDEAAMRGCGTQAECQHAYNLNIPIFLVDGMHSRDQVPTWLQALTTQIFDNIPDALNYIVDLPPKILLDDGPMYLDTLTGEPTLRNIDRTDYVYSQVLNDIGK